MTTKQAISTPKAPAAIGPYSQAIRCGNLLFCSGQVPFNPQTMEMETGDIRAQTKRVLLNILAVLEAAQSHPKNVLKTTIFLQSMNDFAAVNEVYEAFFKEHAPGVAAPARSTVEVAKLPRNALVEIETIAEI